MGLTIRYEACGQRFAPERSKMKKNKFQHSSDVFAHFDIGNEGLSFNAVLPEEKKIDSPLELNQKLTALHAAHKDMHPVLFTVLAALHEAFNNQNTITNPSQGVEG
jgi:hypothetical protein